MSDQPTPAHEELEACRDGRCAACGSPSNGYVWVGTSRAEYAAARPELAREMTLEPDHHDVELCSDECDWRVFPEERPGQWYTVDLERDPRVRGRWTFTAEPRDVHYEAALEARTTIVRDLHSSFVHGSLSGDFFAEARPDLVGVGYYGQWDEPVHPPGIVFDAAVMEVIALAHARTMTILLQESRATSRGAERC